jgi:hypothetical protein
MNTSTPEETKEYMVTLSTGAPEWKSSKWIVGAAEKSEALNFAMLCHDDSDRPQEDRWPVSMVTLSYRGTNPSADESEYTIADSTRVDRLLRIYLHGKERLENC